MFRQFICNYFHKCLKCLETYPAWWRARQDTFTSCVCTNDNILPMTHLEKKKTLLIVQITMYT